MNSESTEKQAKEAIINLLRQKGYRNRFALSVPGSNFPRQYGMLAKCLEVFFMLLKEGRAPSGKLELDTTAPYNDRITCKFKLEYQEVKGFIVRELTVHKMYFQSRQFNLSHNQQVPGSMTLESLFPKPKPWDNIRKGKFRP